MSTLLAQRGVLHSFVSRKSREFGEELDMHGLRFEGHAHTQIGNLLLSAACDTGGKEGNQDAVSFYVPRQPFPMRWAAAVTDGVTASLFSEEGSQLACHTALLALTRSYQQNKLPACPVKLCLKYFRRSIGERVQAEPDLYQPHDFSQSGWKRVVRDGKYLQTTLMVVWEDLDGLHIEGIGDGGLIVQCESEAPPLCLLPASNKPVRCLGPSNSQTHCDYRFRLTTWKSLCLFTDGLTHLVPQRLQALHEANQHHFRNRNANPAARVLGQILEEDANRIEDNVTLFSASKEQR